MVVYKDLVLTMAKFNFHPLDLWNDSRNRPRSVAASDYLTGKTIHVFPSVRAAERELGINASNIVSCLKGRIKTAGGYLWSYMDEGEDNA